MALFLSDREPDYLDLDDDARHGYCPACKCNVTAKSMDFGIGCFEYWGSREVHVDIREVCPECEGDLLDAEPEEETDLED
jgi:hypothetical protein